MSSDARTLVDVDKRFPASMAGDAGKILQVKSDASGYEHVPTSGREVGEVIMWVLDTPPAGFLSCRTSASDTTEYATASYPALGAKLEPKLPGPSGAGYFQTPVINFAKNSGGTNTLDQEAESVGTHGHTEVATGGHTHTVSISSSGTHTHDVYRRHQTGVGSVDWCFDNVSKESVDQDTGSSGAHTHTGSASTTGSHTHTINNHTGVNQPACTLLHFCIKY